MDIDKINKDFDFLFKMCKMTKKEILDHAGFLYKYYGGFDKDFKGLCKLNEPEFYMMLELYVMNKKSEKIKSAGEIIGVEVKHESIFKTFQKNDSKFTYGQYLKEKIINESKCKKNKTEELEDLINLAIISNDTEWRNELMTTVYNLSK